MTLAMWGFHSAAVDIDGTVVVDAAAFDGVSTSAALDGSAVDVDGAVVGDVAIAVDIGFNGAAGAAVADVQGCTAIDGDVFLVCNGLSVQAEVDRAG